MPKKTSKNIPHWDLTDLYSGLHDPKLEHDFQSASEQVEHFRSMYMGQINSETVTADRLLSALQEYEAILEKVAQLGVYAQLVFSTDSSKQAHGAFLQDIRKKTVELINPLVFFELELGAMRDELFASLVQDPKLTTYQHYLDLQRRFSKHRLTEKEEQLIRSKHITGRQAFVRLFEQQVVEQKYVLKTGKKTKMVSQAEILNSTLFSPNQETRKQGAVAFSQGLKQMLPDTTYITNVLAEDWAIEAKYRNYSSPEMERHLENEIDPAIVEVMTSLVADNYSLAQQFFKLKRKTLGLKTMYDYDRYVPVRRAKTNIEFSEGKQIVLDAFSRFSGEYSAVARAFFDKKHIDASIRPGKQNGAFCMYVTPQIDPYILLNYNGSLENVMTLAHELGHGVHGMIARKQTYLNFNWPITIAEVASIFGEMIVFDALQEKIKSRQERFALYMGLLDRVMSTVFRQVSMYRFEQGVHQARAKGELTTDQINSLWEKEQKKLYGSSVTLTPDYSVWWSYIPHFIHTPFYVYAYAFGELLTLSLFAQYRQHGVAFAEKYMTLLASGGSKTPAQLLQPLDIQLEKAEFWQGGIKTMEDLLIEANALYTGK